MNGSRQAFSSGLLIVTDTLLAADAVCFSGTWIRAVMWCLSSMCEASEKDLYEVLGAERSDTLTQIRHRYQQLILQYHPDRCRADGSLAADSGLKKFLEIDAAWKVLSDQTSRTAYDVRRRALDLKQDWPVDSTVFLQDMTWDQGECAYRYGCRCGGEFSVTEEEVQEESQQNEGEEGEQRGVLSSRKEGILRRENQNELVLSANQHVCDITSSAGT
ncbi:hypothetical protein LDENG_00191650 [Lucifuga dentata]|nr:hypothetical protein LDENG_00191650 [Lucifuga dentata]